MDRAIVLLLLGLTEAALHRLAPPNEPIAFSAEYGASALTVPLTDFPAEPSVIAEWSMSTWIYLSSGMGTLLTTFTPYITVNWYGNNLSLYAEGTNVAVTTDGFPIKWIFVQIGSTTETTYGLVTIRGGAQHYMSATRNIKVSSSTSIKIAQSCGPMIVMKT